MATYVHKCSEEGCPHQEPVEIQYSMQYVGNEEELPEETKSQIRCKCHPEKFMPRVPQQVQVKGLYGGSSLSGVEKKAAIKKDRKARSNADFAKNVYPTLPESEKKHFRGRHKDMKEKPD